MQSNSFLDAMGKKKRSGMIVADSIYKRAHQKSAVDNNEIVENRDLNENDEFSDAEVETKDRRDSGSRKSGFEEKL